MRNELLDLGNKSTNILKSVIQASTNICKKRYVKPVLHENSHMELYRKCKKLFDNRQMYALKHVYKWRDELARAEDESTGWVYIYIYNPSSHRFMYMIVHSIDS